ncbi:MAG: amidase family protein [Acidimicrobiales bacterium]
MSTESATSLAAAIRAKEISSRELLTSFLDRIDKLNGPINAVVTLDAERALAAADDADAATARGESFGPLHGLPTTIKDAIATAGIRSTGGAVELSDHVPTADAPAVARLKAAGAIVFGKTNLPRWSGDLETFNDIFGTTNNPWDLDRIPGGSSGGAGAAVAAGLTSFELGTDIGGSVRIPSHFNGVFGLKPSFGVVPQRGYLDHTEGGTIDVDINVFGPLARSADDLELLLGVLAGPDSEQAVAWSLDLPPAKGSYRVGVWFDEPTCPVARDYRGLLTAAADRLADAGLKVEEAHPPVDFGAQVMTFNLMVLAAMSPSQPAEIADTLGSHHQWIRQAIERNRLRAIWAEWFESYDILLCPVTPSAALPHKQGEFAMRTMTIDDVERSYFDNVAWTGLIGVVGLPSAVPPIGRTPDRLPVGVQCVAPYLRDRDAIDVARMLGTYEPPPGFA